MGVSSCGGGIQPWLGGGGKAATNLALWDFRIVSSAVAVTQKYHDFD
jgi:hypothetical protein